jgi:hypothetical protein
MGYDAQSEDFTAEEVGQHTRYKNEETAAVIQHVLSMGDPLEAAWPKFRQEFAVQKSVWESQLLRRAFAEARKSKSFDHSSTRSFERSSTRSFEQSSNEGSSNDLLPVPIPESIEETLEKQKKHEEVAIQAVLEAVLEVASTNPEEPIPALESVLERAKPNRVLTTSTELAGQAVIRGQRAAVARRRLVELLQSEEHQAMESTWDHKSLETLVRQCDLGNNALEYRTRQVLRMGLRGALYRPGQSSERRNSKVCQRVIVML